MAKAGETFSTADSTHQDMSLLCLFDAFDSIEERRETTSAVFTFIKHHHDSFFRRMSVL